MASHSSLQWLALVATMWLQSVNSPNSDFPIYSSQLKELKNISQTGLNFLAFASDAGKLFGCLSGLAALHLPLWLVAIIGGSLSLFGYGLQFIFLHSSQLTYLRIFLLTAIAGNGICWINTVCYLVTLRNFGPHGRAAVGLSTSYAGLSAKVFVVIATAVFGEKSEQKARQYLLVNAVVPILVTGLVAQFLRVVRTGHEPEFGFGFVAMFVIAVTTGVCAVVGSIERHFSGGFTIGLGLLLAAPLVVPAAVKFMEDIRGERNDRQVHDVSVDELEGGRRGAVEVRVKEGVREENCVREIGGVMIFQEVDFWLYFLGYMFSATLGMVFLNNLGQIAEARGIGDASGLVSLASAFGFFGRLVPSILDHYCSRNNTISRPASLAALMVPMAASFFALVNPSKLFLCIATTIIGASTGAITSTAVSATSELFGVKHFGMNHNIVVTNIPIGSFVFGYFAAFVYQKNSDGTNTCFGSRCYGKTFVVWGITCSVGALLCATLYTRRRKLR